MSCSEPQIWVSEFILVVQTQTHYQLGVVSPYGHFLLVTKRVAESLFDKNKLATPPPADIFKPNAWQVRTNNRRTMSPRSRCRCWFMVRKIVLSWRHWLEEATCLLGCITCLLTTAPIVFFPTPGRRSVFVASTCDAIRRKSDGWETMCTKDKLTKLRILNNRTHRHTDCTSFTSSQISFVNANPTQSWLRCSLQSRLGNLSSRTSLLDCTEASASEWQKKKKATAKTNVVLLAVVSCCGFQKFRIPLTHSIFWQGDP